MKFTLKKLCKFRIWKRLFLERATEPTHLNLAAAAVAICGSWETKEAFDLIPRAHNAYCILDAARRAKHLKIPNLAICEFGVAAGAGLINMALIARKVTLITGVNIKVFGFDTAEGMPPAIDYRDHPDLYAPSEYRMDVARLGAILPANAELVIGNVSDTVVPFLDRLKVSGYTLGYVVLDVDYYSSTRDALQLFKGQPEIYLPLVRLYLDDIEHVFHNPSCGELLAVDEWNAGSTFRKIYRDEFLENRRIFRRANWIKHIRCLHVLDHPGRQATKRARFDLDNPYL